MPLLSLKTNGIMVWSPIFTKAKFSDHKYELTHTGGAGDALLALEFALIQTSCYTSLHPCSSSASLIIPQSFLCKTTRPRLQNPAPHPSFHSADREQTAPGRGDGPIDRVSRDGMWKGHAIFCHPVLSRTRQTDLLQKLVSLNSRQHKHLDLLLILEKLARNHCFI